MIIASYGEALLGSILVALGYIDMNTLLSSSFRSVLQNATAPRGFQQPLKNSQNHPF